MSNLKTKPLLLMMAAVAVAFAVYYSFYDKSKQGGINLGIKQEVQKKVEVITEPTSPKVEVKQEQSSQSSNNNKTSISAPPPALTSDSSDSIPRFLEMIDFKTLSLKTIMQTKDLYVEKEICNSKPVVVEFFSYGCPGCETAEQHFNKWEQTKNNNVKFIKYPVAIHDPDNMLAKAFYTNKHLGYNKLDSVDEVLFDIGTDTGTHASLDLIVSRLKPVISNFNEDKFRSTYSNISKSTIDEGNRLFHKYQLRGTPSVVVNNKYVVKLNSYARMFDTIDYLTQKENAVCPSNSG